MEILFLYNTLPAAGTVRQNGAGTQYRFFSANTNEYLPVMVDTDKITDDFTFSYF